MHYQCRTDPQQRAIRLGKHVCFFKGRKMYAHVRFATGGEALQYLCACQYMLNYCPTLK